MNLEALYTLISNYLIVLEHKENRQSRMSDSEIILAYIFAFYAHSGNYAKALWSLKQSKAITYVLSRSRYSRRLKKLKIIIKQIFYLMGEMTKQNCSIYQIDSFPVKVCHNIRISRCKLINGEEYRGKNQSKREYFYGFKVHVLTAENGQVVEYQFVAGSANDSKAFDLFDFDLPEGSEAYADSGYTAYYMEEVLNEAFGIKFLPLRKINSKMHDNHQYVNYYRQYKRKIIETFISMIKGLYPTKIHATDLKGFVFKLFGFIFAHNLYLLLEKEF